MNNGKTNNHHHTALNQGINIDHKNIDAQTVREKLAIWKWYFLESYSFLGTFLANFTFCWDKYYIKKGMVSSRAYADTQREISSTYCVNWRKNFD